MIPYLAGLIGNLLKYANVANDLAQNDKIVKSYIEALEWMFIIRRIHPFVKNSAKRQTIGMPKLHFLDTGLACYLLGIRTPRQLSTSPIYGALLESFVYNECLKHLSWASEDVGIYHFRDKQKNEVDLVLEGGGGRLTVIEVKASASVNEADFKGLTKLAEFTGHRFANGLLFYGGNRILPFLVSVRRFYAIPFSLLMEDLK